jgi:ATP-binding cassette subfamily B (MDR/TAP) protein 1
MISHKLATVEKADKIVVIDHGKIVEEGTHAELLAKDSIYCRLLQAQDLGIPADTEKITATVHDMERVFHEKLLSQPSQHIPAELATSPVLNSKAISRRHGVLPLVYYILSDTKSVPPPFMGGTLGAFIAGLCIPAQAYLSANLVTVFTLQGEALIHGGNFWSFMFFVLALTNLGSYAILWSLYAIAGAGISLKYRAKYLSNLLNQDLSFFETKGNESGALAALLSSDGEDLEMFFAMSIGLVLTFFVDIISCSILAIALKWKLGLVGVLGCLPVLFLAGHIWLRMDKGRGSRSVCCEFFGECKVWDGGCGSD